MPAASLAEEVPAAARAAAARAAAGLDRGRFPGRSARPAFARALPHLGRAESARWTSAAVSATRSNCVLIHSLGHLEGGPQAVNYLFAKCVDVGPEKYMKDRLKGNPVSCPSIRKKIPHITRRVQCNCPFEFASDRYPTPVLYLLTLPAERRCAAAPPVEPELRNWPERYGAMERRKAEILAEWDGLRTALVDALRRLPERSLACPGGRYRLLAKEGIEELTWQPEKDAG